MKIAINFSKPAGRLAPYLAGVLMLLSVVAVFATIALYVSARRISADVPVLEERLAHYRDREMLKPANLLSNDQLVALRARVRELNALTSATGPSLSLLFIRLEKLIPDGVWLVSLHYRSRENRIKLVAEASHAELLTDFMRQMERSGYFSQVLLTRQAQHPDNTRRAVQFEFQLQSKI